MFREERRLEHEERHIRHEERRLEHEERRDEFRRDEFGYDRPAEFRHEERREERYEFRHEERREERREEREIRREERDFGMLNQSPVVQGIVVNQAPAAIAKQGSLVALFNVEHKHYLHVESQGDADCHSRDSGEGSQWEMISLSSGSEKQFRCISSGLYLCAAGNGTFHTRGQPDDPYCRFRVESQPNGSIVIQLPNGEFLGASMLGHLKGFTDGRSERCHWKVEMMRPLV